MKKTVHYFRHPEPHRPPPLWLTGLEPGRLVTEVIALSATRKHLLKKHPAGDGHPVLVFPGLLASDRSTAMLRRFIADAGYQCHGWSRGSNLGPSQDDQLEQDITALVDRLYAEHGNRKLSLVGWSLGGVYARLAAHMMPDKIRQVITLGSPINGSPSYTNAWRLYEMVSDMDIDDPDNLDKLALVQRPLPVPATSIFSKTDSIVAWQISRAAKGERQQNVCVKASHVGMAFSPLVLDVILDRLAQDQDNWAPCPAVSLNSLLFAA